MSNYQFFATLALVACFVLFLWIFKHRFEIRAALWTHFALIRLAAFAGLAVGGGLAAWRFLRSTQDITARVKLLRPYWTRGAGIPVAKTRDGITLYLPELLRCEQVQVVAPTGRGKTESVIVPWLLHDVTRGASPVLIDGKGDPRLAAKIREMVARLTHPPEVVVFDLGNPATSCTINPLEQGTPQQITDRVFTAFVFEQSFYRAVQADLTRALCELIQAVDLAPVTFHRLHELLTEPAKLPLVLSQIKNPKLQTLFRAHLMKTQRERDEVCAGIVSQIAPFAVGEAAALVNGPVTGKTHLNVSDMILTPGLHRGKLGLPGQKILIILLPTLLYQDLGFQLGKCLLQELGGAIGRRASLSSGEELGFTPVFLDEFSAFVYPGFSQILNKARSTQVALHLSHQSLADLSMASPEFAASVNTNTNIKCVLGVNDPETADFFARHFGTRTEQKETRRARDQGLFGRAESGDLSLRDVEAYKIHPNQLKKYTRGQGVLHFPSPSGNVTEEVQFLRVTD